MELSFEQCLSSSKRILVFSGAGLSIPSGFPGLRTVCEGAMDIVTQEAWDTDPAAVWQFYTARRRQAVQAKPNEAHVALASLAQKLGARMLTVSHTVDDLQVQAGSPPDTLVSLLGNIFAVKCTNFKCCFATVDKSDPLVPALNKSEFGSEFYVKPQDLPRCPKCDWMLRPDCVWFGDALSNHHLKQIDEFIFQGVDMVLLIGMSGTVWPTAGYVEECLQRGARLAIFNTDSSTRRDGAWLFIGDATQTVPRILRVGSVA